MRRSINGKPAAICKLFVWYLVENANFRSDVRFKSSPIEFSIFDNGNSDQFLGRAQLLPRADRRADAPVSLPLEGREDFEHVSGTLLVDAHILEKRPDPHLEDFVIRDSERSTLIAFVFLL